MKRRKRRRKSKAKVISRLKPIHNSSRPHVSVVIPVMNERRTIARVIAEAAKVHRETEVIVVANGSRDGTEQIALRMGAKVIHYEEPLGHDVGRTIGVKKAQGEVILFTDGDVIISAADLIPLVRTIDKGADVALNKYLGPTNKQNVHPVILSKHAVNIMLSRSDLKGVSMTTIPHALSRRAVDLIGPENLSVPPLAHSIAIHKGLRVLEAHYIDVGRKNPRKRKKKNGTDPLERLIIGDHLEAIHWLTAAMNSRGNFPDLARDRKRVR